MGDFSVFGSVAVLAVIGVACVLVVVCVASFALLAAIRAYVPDDEDAYVSPTTRAAIVRRDGRVGAR